MSNIQHTEHRRKSKSFSSLWIYQKENFFLSDEFLIFIKSSSCQLLSMNCFSIQQNYVTLLFIYLLNISHILCLPLNRKKIVYCFSKKLLSIFSHWHSLQFFFVQNIMFRSCFSSHFFISIFTISLAFALFFLSLFFARCYFSRKFHWVEPLVRGKKKKRCEFCRVWVFSVTWNFPTPNQFCTIKSSILLVSFMT